MLDIISEVNIDLCAIFKDKLEPLVIYPNVNCKIDDLELEHKAHMTLYYHYHNIVLKMKAPTDTLGKVCMVNTVSDDPKKWFLL